jgi:hypothetical protein
VVKYNKLSNIEWRGALAPKVTTPARRGNPGVWVVFFCRPNERWDTGKKGDRKMIISVRKVILVCVVVALLFGGWVFWRNRNQTRFGLTPKEIEEIERRAEEIAPFIVTLEYKQEPEKFADILRPELLEGLKVAKEIMALPTPTLREEIRGEPKLVEYKVQEVLKPGQLRETAIVEFPAVLLDKEGKVVQEHTLLLFLGREKEGDEWLVGAVSRKVQKEGS